VARITQKAASEFGPFPLIDESNHRNRHDMLIFFWATKLWTEHRGNGRRGQKNEMRCTRRTEYSAIRCPINRRSFL